MDITVEELKAEVAKLHALDSEHDEANKIKKEVYARLQIQESKVKMLLETLELPEFEKVKIVTVARANVPKDPEDKRNFFDYLIEKGVYDAYRTVNSNSINSFVKAEYELAKERGELNFSIPGIEIIEDTKLKY